MKQTVFLLLLGVSLGALLLPSTVRCDGIIKDDDKNDASKSEVSEKAIAVLAGYFNLSLLAHLCSIMWMGSTVMAHAIQELLQQQCTSKDGRFDPSMAAKLVDHALSGSKNGIWPNLVQKFVENYAIGHELGDVLKANFGDDTTDSKILEKLTMMRHVRGVMGPAKGSIGMILQLINGPAAVYPPHQNIPSTGGPATSHYPAAEGFH